MSATSLKEKVLLGGGGGGGGGRPRPRAWNMAQKSRGAKE